MAEHQISLDGIPAPVARAIEVVVQMTRRLTDNSKNERGGPAPELPRWEGRVIGKLSRRELYDDG